MVHTWPQTLQGESVAKPETFLLVVLSIVCKMILRRSMVISPIRFLFKKIVRCGNILGMLTIVETVAHTLGISYYLTLKSIPGAF